MSDYLFPQNIGGVLRLEVDQPFEVYLGGLQISRGDGRHMDRSMGCFDLLFVRQGVLPIQEEQNAFQVTAGQTLLLWPHRHHYGTANFSPEMQLYWMHFNIAEDEGQPLSSTYQQATVDVPQYTTVARPDVLELLFRRFLDDQATNRLLPHYASLLVKLMLCEIADQRAVGTVNRQKAVVAGRALAYIRAHIHQTLSASTVAEHLGYQPEYLNRIFHQIYHHTLTQEIHLSRMGNARHLLLHSNQSVKEIAARCGITDANYFVRLFKRYEGVSPTAFRRIHAQADVNYE